MPTAFGCYTDIKPGSYPNSINVDNNGVITIAIQEETVNEETVLPECVKLILYNSDGTLVSVFRGIPPTYVPHTYQYVDHLVIDPKLTGLKSDGYYEGPGYILKFRTQDISGLYTDVIDKEDYRLDIRFWDSHVVDSKGNLIEFVGSDSVRLIKK